MTDLRQLHFRFRTDAGTADASPTWGAGEDVNYYPGTANFRLRIGLRNASTVVAATPWELYVSRNGDTYTPVTTTIAKGVQSVDAGSSADDTQVLIPRLYPFTTDWILSGAAIDLDFAGSRVFPGASFTDYLSISRASAGYALTASGTLTSFSSNQLRQTDLGLLCEEARTNLVLRNRDLTNAVWTKSNATAALDQTGPDGSANSASSLLATAGNATALQSITDASTARFQTAWVKRLIGSGTINMTMDNGATWTAVTVTTDWSRVSIPSQTIANPTVGFRIVTSGDKIAIDFVQNEAGSFASSEIATTTTSATRAADLVNAVGSLDTVLAGTAKSSLVDVIVPQRTGVIGAVWVGGSSFFHLLKEHDTFQQVRSDANDATQLVATIGNSLSYTTGVKIAFAGDGSGRSIVGGGGTVATDAKTVTLTSGLIYIGSTTSSGGIYTGGYIRRLAVWSSRLDDVTLDALTAP